MRREATPDEVAKLSTIIQERFPDAGGRFALSRILDTAGQLDEAIAWAMEAKRLDPRHEEVSRDIAERLARIGLDAESKRVEPESSLRILFWQRRYDEIIDRMSNVDLDDADADSLGYLAFALQAIGRDSEAIPILESMGLPNDRDGRRPPAMGPFAPPGRPGGRVTQCRRNSAVEETCSLAGSIRHEPASRP